MDDNRTAHQYHSSRKRGTRLAAMLACGAFIVAGCGEPKDKPASQAAAKVNGDEVTVQAGDQGVRFLLVSGKPLGEPVAWYGPIVMNTQEQLRQAFEELERGTFLKRKE